MFCIERGVGWFAAAVMVALCACVRPAASQTTSGNASNGAALWTSKSCGGCHAINAKPVNAANAGGHILFAIANGMPTLVTATEANDLAAYIGASVGTGTTIVPPNSGANGIDLGGLIYLNSPYGKYTGINVITPPAKGTVSISGTIATYTPAAGQLGADSFTYQAVVAGGCSGACSSVRTQNISIGVPNDNFANSIPLSGLHATATATNLGAGKEAGEPNHAGNAGGRSVWWSWTAPYSLPVTITTAGSNLNTLLGVYTGTAVNALAAVASNDNCSNGCLPANTSSVTFTAVAFTTYQIAVDGFGGATGNIQLDINMPLPPPANDNWANAIAIVPPATTATGSSLGATTEPGEPDTGGSTNTQSVWWKWTAPASGIYQVNLIGSTDFSIYYPYFTRVTVYTGNSLATLQPVSQAPALFGASALPYGLQTFSAVAGTTYYFLVASTTGNAGTASLHILSTGNDNYDGRLRLFGPRVTASGSNAGATLESGEPGTGTASVWFSWTPRGTAPVTIDTCGSNFTTTLGIYGTSIFSPGTLSQVARNDNITTAACAAGSLQFTPTGFGEYEIRVSGIGAGTGNYVLHIFQRQTQSIDFRPLPDQVMKVSSIALNATAEAGTPVTFASATPLTCSVTGSTMTLLAPGTCTIVASDGGNTDYFPADDVAQSFAITPPPVNYTGIALSRKFHAGIGSRDLLLNSAFINGAVAVESRAIGAGHVIVFVFDGPVYGVDLATAVDANGNPAGNVSANFTPGGTEVAVTLVNVPDNFRASISVAGVNSGNGSGGANASVSLGFLAGDTNSSLAVNAADISAVKARMGKPVGSADNYRFDLDGNGRIDQADVAIVRAKSGITLP